MKPILALSLAPLGAGWAFNLPDRRPSSGFMTFGTNSHTDDELWRYAQMEMLASINFHKPAIVAVTAVADDARFAPRIYAYQVIARALVKAKLPGAAKLIDIAEALESFTGVERFASKSDADKAAMLEACRRNWLDLTTLTTDRALALAVWTHMAAQQLPDLAFNPPKPKRGRP